MTMFTITRKSNLLVLCVFVNVLKILYYIFMLQLKGFLAPLKLLYYLYRWIIAKQKVHHFNIDLKLICYVTFKMIWSTFASKCFIFSTYIHGLLNGALN